jgi:hypothetical protein
MRWFVIISVLLRNTIRFEVTTVTIVRYDPIRSVVRHNGVIGVRAVRRVAMVIVCGRDCSFSLNTNVDARL